MLNQSNLPDYLKSMATATERVTSFKFEMEVHRDYEIHRATVVSQTLTFETGIEDFQRIKDTMRYGDFSVDSVVLEMPVPPYMPLTNVAVPIWNADRTAADVWDFVGFVFSAEMNRVKDEYICRFQMHLTTSPKLRELTAHERTEWTIELAEWEQAHGITPGYLRDETAKISASTS